MGGSNSGTGGQFGRSTSDDQSEEYAGNSSRTGSDYGGSQQGASGFSKFEMTGAGTEGAGTSFSALKRKTRGCDGLTCAFVLDVHRGRGLQR